jgi:Fe-S-cluster containining protein
VPARTKRKRPAKETPKSLSPAQRERAIRKLYERIPEHALTCRGLCHDSCGAIGYSQAEARMMAFKHGTPPMANGFTRGGFRESDDIMCDKLTPDKRCSIYEDRPAICRVYGLLRALQCPHGCVPSEWMEDDDVVALFVELDAIEGRHKLSHDLAAMVATAARLQGVIK